MISLRPWQQAAREQARKWLLVDGADKRFLINAAPGAGKTIAACVIADDLLRGDEIDRVVVIAPRAEVVSQWADDFRRVTGRFMTKVTARDGDVSALSLDVCATWAAVVGLQGAMQAVCRASRVLVICDEHHHAAVQAAWGISADSAFVDARFALVLTGTPMRSDGENAVWLAHDDAGAIDHPPAGTYTLTYGDAVDLGYCRPVTFHRHEGHFSVDLEDGEHINICGERPAIVPKKLARIPGLQRALEFYRLACTPLYEPDGVTPQIEGYQGTMIASASEKLSELRHRMPNAGGLVVAPTIDIAEYFVDLITRVDGEAPLLVHSELPNAESRIKAFRNTERRWLVSVAMVSEGVDIPRLRVLVYLPSAQTELAFRQAVGRVVRSAGPSDDTRAYVVMPSFQRFEDYARRVESEMPVSARQAAPIRTKRCSVCATECQLSATVCTTCESEFPAAPPRIKKCQACGALNSASATNCDNCGRAFSPQFTVTLDEALRVGAIVRGMDVSEPDVQAAETMAPAVRAMVLRSGDHTLVRLLRTLPDESWARLKTILDHTNASA
jgi:superfamily II DNA or RNA helicase